MTDSIHSVAYKRLKQAFGHMTFGMSLGFRIYFSTFLILFTTSASYFFLLYFQNARSAITDTILNTNIKALDAARNLKESVVAYDNVIFRYVATKSNYDLSQAQEIRRRALIDLETIKILTNSTTIRSRLTTLLPSLKSYFLESKALVEYSRSNKLPAAAGLFAAASWARDQNAKSHEMSILSYEGSQRMERVLALCDEILTYNYSRLDAAQSELNALGNKSRQTIRIVFCLGFIVVLAVSMMLAITMIGPLRILMGGVKKMESGEYDLELPITTSTEIGQLTLAFNSMAKTIHTQRERLMKETITDNLTGAYNQRYFVRRLEEESDRSKRAAEPLSLMMIDVDHFKKFNDTMGHEMGNVVLKRIAELIRENLRNVDLLFRYGGDEFAALLPGANASNSQIIAKRLIESVRKISSPGDSLVNTSSLSLSIGGATFPDSAVSLTELKERADSQLYQAKAEGRNCFRWERLN